MSFCPSVLRERVYDKSFAKPSGEGWKYERRAAHFQMVNDDRDFSLSQECVNLALPKLGCCCEPLSKSSWLRHFSFWLVERRISDEGVRVFWHHFLAAFSTKTPKKTSQCLKINDKVVFNIASEANYVYILSGQKCSSKMPKKLVSNGKLKFSNVTFRVIFKHCVF